MKTVQFIADNAASVLAQVHAELGPDAVVLNVRPLPAEGVARLWQRNRRIEITAAVPDEAAADPIPASAQPEGFFFGPGEASTAVPTGRWRCVAWLEAMGLAPVHADQLQQELSAANGSAPPTLDAEWILVNGALTSRWRPAPVLDYGTAPRPHVFVGPPGSGKTTVLCKWLTLATLTEERLARVWRLDGATANTADFLTVHGEMLGTPVERFWSGTPAPADLWFVDLPGIESDDASALAALREQLASLGSPRIHLVLNAAYETSTLFAQWRAFSVLQPEDFIFTHLDEELRRVKLWNFIFGTNCSLRFLSAGQKIPGQFHRATPRLLFPVENRT